MTRRSCIKTVAILFALFHLIVVVVPLLLSGAIGESQAFSVMLFDCPLEWLVSVLPGGNIILYGDGPAYTQIFGIGGTLMYTGVGAFIGWVIDVIRRKSRPA